MYQFRLLHLNLLWSQGTIYKKTFHWCLSYQLIICRLLPLFAGESIIFSINYLVIGIDSRWPFLAIKSVVKEELYCCGEME